LINSSLCISNAWIKWTLESMMWHLTGGCFGFAFLQIHRYGRVSVPETCSRGFQFGPGEVGR
jgi:hypothetical protein